MRKKLLYKRTVLAEVSLRCIAGASAVLLFLSITNKEKDMNKTWYTGIADSEGIESFLPADEVDSQQIAMWGIRAASNPHRFATVYRAQLDDETATNVKKWLKEEKWGHALRAMWKGISEKNLNAQATNKKHWKLITKHGALLHRLLKETE